MRLACFNPSKECHWSRDKVLLRPRHCPCIEVFHVDAIHKTFGGHVATNKDASAAFTGSTIHETCTTNATGMALPIYSLLSRDDLLNISPHNPANTIREVNAIDSICYKRVQEEGSLKSLGASYGLCNVEQDHIVQHFLDGHSINGAVAVKLVGCERAGKKSETVKVHDIWRKLKHVQCVLLTDP